jgi:hypothetical protein
MDTFIGFVLAVLLVLVILGFFFLTVYIDQLL